MASNINVMDVGDINPYVRHARVGTLEKGFDSGLRYNRHYQLHYVIEGEAHFDIAGSEYTARIGDLCLWAPGDLHSIAASKKCASTVIGVQFDLTRNFSKLHYIPMHYNPNDFNASFIHEKIVFTDFPGFSAFTKIKNQQLAESLLRQIVHCFIYGGKYSDVKSSVKLKELLILLVEAIDESDTRTPREEIKSHFLGHIMENFQQDLSNEALAEKLGYHPVHLNRLITEMTGMSLHQYIIQQRIGEALQLLESTNLSISQVAENVGYANPQYFSRLFKAKTGYPPSYFRKK